MAGGWKRRRSKYLNWYAWFNPLIFVLFLGFFYPHLFRFASSGIERPLDLLTFCWWVFRSLRNNELTSSLSLKTRSKDEEDEEGRKEFIFLVHKEVMSAFSCCWRPNKMAIKIFWGWWGSYSPSPNTCSHFWSSQSSFFYAINSTMYGLYNWNWWSPKEDRAI